MFLEVLFVLHNISVIYGIIGYFVLIPFFFATGRICTAHVLPPLKYHEKDTGHDTEPSLKKLTPSHPILFPCPDILVLRMQQGSNDYIFTIVEVFGTTWSGFDPRPSCQCMKTARETYNNSNIKLKMGNGTIVRVMSKWNIITISQQPASTGEKDPSKSGSLQATTVKFWCPGQANVTSG